MHIVPADLHNAINVAVKGFHKLLYSEYIIYRGRSPFDSRNHPRQIIG
jgi:hypothetical protein